LWRNYRGKGTPPEKKVHSDRKKERWISQHCFHSRSMGSPTRQAWTPSGTSLASLAMSVSKAPKGLSSNLVPNSD